MIRRKKNDNPMVAPKRRPAPLTKTSIPPRKPTKQNNGVTGKDDLVEPRALNEEALMEQIKPIIFNDEASASGFTDPNLKEGSYEDLELWTTKRELREGFRYHMARFIAKKSVDPRKEDDFQRPVRLHRRDPKTKTPGKVEENGKLEPNGIENKEIEEWRAKREEEREAHLAQIAPDALTGQKRKKISQQKAAEVHGVLQTDEQKARGVLRYEEALPWHFEDFDNKNTWVGSYEEAMSGVNAVFTFQNGRVTMVPLEKWYKFTRKDIFKTMNIEEVEKSFQKKSKEPRWMMDHQEKESEKKDQVAMARINRGLYVGKEAKDEVSRPGGRKHDDDADEIDADGADEFADDEEDALFEADEEESKAIQKRIKKDQLQANIFNLKAEKEYEMQERLEEKEKEAEKISGKAMRKALKKREKRFVYQSDEEDDYNPFSDSVCPQYTNPPRQ
jgi:transcription initiation factor TFIIF subunit alpha